MLRAIATVSLPGTQPEKLNAIADAGFGQVEIFADDLRHYPGSAAEIRQMCADLGLHIALYQPFRDFEGASRAQFPGHLQRARQALAITRQLGCDKMLLCSSTAADSSPDIDLQISDLRALAALAEEEGVQIGYEALAWGTRVNRWRQAWERVRAVDSPALGIVLDSFHVLSLGDDLRAIGDVPIEKITFVQLADAPRKAMDVQAWSRHYRCLPGQGDLPVIEFTRALLDRGYRGPWSLEIFNDRGGVSAADAWRSLAWLDAQVMRHAG